MIGKLLFLLFNFIIVIRKNRDKRKSDQVKNQLDELHEKVLPQPDLDNIINKEGDNDKSTSGVTE